MKRLLLVLAVAVLCLGDVATACDRKARQDTGRWYPGKLIDRMALTRQAGECGSPSVAIAPSYSPPAPVFNGPAANTVRTVAGEIKQCVGGVCPLR